MEVLYWHMLYPVKYDVKSYGDLFRLKLRLQRVDEELCKAQKEMYRDMALQKRSCKTVEDMDFFEAYENGYRKRLKQIKLQKNDNRKKLKAVERCLERDGSLAEAELEMRIPVGDVEDMAEIVEDDVPKNPYRVQEDVDVSEMFSDEVTDEIVPDVGEIAESTVSGVATVGKTVITDIECAVEADVDAMSENVELSLQNDDIRECGKTVRLPADKADYMRRSVAEKVRCYSFDDKGTDTAFEMVQTYFKKIGMDTCFDSVYKEAKLLTNYYEKQKSEEFIRERTEQIIGAMKVMGLDAGNLVGYSADVLSEVFRFRDMGYFAGIKLFNNVTDRLGVDMDQQKRYEVFDRIYEEGLREK